MELQYCNNDSKALSKKAEFPPDWLQDPTLRIRRKYRSISELDGEKFKDRCLMTVKYASHLRWLPKWKVYEEDPTTKDECCEDDDDSDLEMEEESAVVPGDTIGTLANSQLLVNRNTQ
ncbi:MAG: hypothetical protein MUD14_09170, partial [Hydrococcus sp. Prado102]|nr:hypothetical protein [Hydrococcus sp. Prado102]